MSDDVADVPAEKETEESREIGTEDLRALLETERRQREDSERRRREAEDRARRAEQERDTERSGRQTDIEARYTSELGAVDASIAAKNAEADRLEREMEAAFSEQRSADYSKAHRRVAALEAEVVHLKARKEWLTQNKDAILAQPKQEAPRQSGIDLSQYSARQRRWIDENPQFLEDEDFRALVAEGHYKATRRKAAVDSDDYFRIIDETVAAERGGANKREDGDEGVATPPAARRREAAPTMPVQRRAPSGSAASSPTRFQLTEAEKEMADSTMSDLPEEDWHDKDGKVRFGRYRQYAHNREMLKRQGRM